MDFFTSDLHYNHKNIIRYCQRPFADVEEMNTALVANWNETVRAVDHVYLLGDIAFGDRDTMKDLRRRLNGRITVVRGNHDRGPDAIKAAGFELCVTELCTVVEGTALYLRHIPDLSASWAPYADFHLCGHVHEKWKRLGNVINVGVDQWGFRPRRLEEVLAAQV